MLRPEFVMPAGLEKMGWGGTGQDRAGQDRTGQDRTGQSRTGQFPTVSESSDANLEANRA